MNAQVVIWGASGHAKVVADILRKSRRYEVAGFLDDVDPQRRGEVFWLIRKVCAWMGSAVNYRVLEWLGEDEGQMARGLDFPLCSDLTWLRWRVY